PGTAYQDRRALRQAVASVLLAEELARIHHPPVLPDLEVHMRARAAPGAAGLGDLAAHAHQLADVRGVARVVRVAGHVPGAEVDRHHVAVARARAGIADHAGGHRKHRIAGAGAEVDALVPGGAATEGIGPTAEARGDVAGGHR